MPITEMSAGTDAGGAQSHHQPDTQRIVNRHDAVRARRQREHARRQRQPQFKHFRVAVGAVGFAFDHPLAFAQAVPQRTQKTVDFLAAPDGQRRFGGEHDVSAAAFEQVLSGGRPAATLSIETLSNSGVSMAARAGNGLS